MLYTSNKVVRRRNEHLKFQLAEKNDKKVRRRRPRTMGNFLPSFLFPLSKTEKMTGRLARSLSGRL